MNEEVKFGEALAELETIVRAIESNEVDLDELAEKVDRAAVLVELCRDRIETTQMRVREIIDGFEPREDA